MKKIIQEKYCNTDTAKRVASYDFDDPSSYIDRETLYVNRNGVFFLHVEGGAESMPFEDIILYDIGEAKAWLERYCPKISVPEVLTPEADRVSQRVLVKLSPDVLSRLMLHRAQTGERYGDLVESLLRDFFEMND